MSGPKVLMYYSRQYLGLYLSLNPTKQGTESGVSLPGKHGGGHRRRNEEELKRCSEEREA